jgi:hypothetical protein
VRARAALLVLALIVGIVGTPAAAAPSGSPSPSGYWLVGADGGVFSFGDAVFYGSLGGRPLNGPIVGMAATPGGHGYWLVASDGGVFTFGDAPFLGSLAMAALDQPIVGMASTREGTGYWLLSRRGDVYAFGNAIHQGSAAGRLAAPAVAIVADRSGGGYRVAARDGEVLSFGAPELGSPTVAPTVGMTATRNGGWWAVNTTGSVGHNGWAYPSQGPNVDDHGSIDFTLHAPIVAIAATTDDRGYFLYAADGGVFTFGDATFSGSMGGIPLNAPIVGGAAVIAAGFCNGPGCPY